MRCQRADAVHGAPPSSFDPGPYLLHQTQIRAEISISSTKPQDPVLRPLVEQDTETLQRMLSEIPLWVKNPDYDRLDWLNKFVEIMWPYLDKAICKTAKTIAKPIIAEQIPKKGQKLRSSNSGKPSASRQRQCLLFTM